MRRSRNCVANPPETLQDYFAQTLAGARGEWLIDDDGFRARRFRYAQLVAAARGAASKLAQAGVSAGDRVLLWSENSAAWAAAFWGCILRGAVVVPLDEKHAADFALRVAQTAQVKLVLTGALVDSALPGFAGWPLTFDETGETSASVTPVTPDSPVEILFTSGATADPKGVVITHRNILANLSPIAREIAKYRWMERPFHPVRFLNLLPLSHMFGQSMALFIPPLLEGVVVFQRSQSPADIVRQIRSRRISVLVAVPRILEILRGHLEAVSPATRQAAPKGTGAAGRWWRYRDAHRRFGLKFWSFVVGGAALDPAVEEFWSGLGFVVVQGYGLTEAAPIVTLNHPFHAARGAVGKPIGGVEIRIAEDGEVLVRGGNVAQGYFNNPEATREVFGDGWLHTGDIGELDAKGQLRLKGRKKEMIVLPDGRNVFPEEIESVLNAAEGVVESAVVGTDSVHAVLVVRDGAEAARIVAEANRRLNDAQRIRSFSVWPHPELPRTEGTRKLKRRAIRDEIEGRAEAPVAAMAGLDEDAELETLAPTSLDRVELLVAMEQKLGVTIDEGAFAQARTVGELRRFATSAPPERAFTAPRWNRQAWAHWHRVVHLNLWVLRLAQIFAWVRVEGRENLPANGPVLFASNHQGFFDTPILFLAMPWKWRHRLAPVMRKEFFDAHFHPERYSRGHWFTNTLNYYLSLLMFNAVPIPQREAGVREALRNLGSVVEDGYSPLVFPEGVHGRDDSVLRFAPGVAMMATKLNIPVVPLRIRGSNRVLHPDWKFPRPGRVLVRIGKPMVLSGDDYAALALDVERAVRAL